ncbi:MAG: UDP-N-acetylmuramate dehydrogenase [Acidobacteriota bacterium]
MKKAINDYLSTENINFLSDHDISEFLTMRVGGKVGFIIFTNSSAELSTVLGFLYNIKKQFIIIGGGSNIIFPDNGTDLIVIRNTSSAISVTEDNFLKVNTGIKNTDFLEYCREHNISGFEFLAGIPGTIGGATAVNAGAFGNSISDRVHGGDIFTENGNTEFKNREYFDFKYRNSRFKYGNDIIINIYLRYTTGDSKVIKDKMNEIIKLRIEKHPPYSAYTAGCFFKNPEINGKKISAGKLIEDCNLKGHDTGSAKVSEKHSNFIVNKGNAGFSDIKNLGIRIQNAVNKENGILLEREVIFVSPEGKKF